MFNSPALEVAIGVIFVILLVSILCTAIREGVEAWLKTRASYLEYGVRVLLHDLSGKGLAKTLFEHPLLYGLFEDGYRLPRSENKPGAFTMGRNLPSYIPSRNFALALMDIAARGPDPHQSNDGGAPILDLEQVRAGIGRIGNGPVQRALLTAIDTAAGDLEQAQKNIEAWYDGSMERVTGWYRRSTQKILFVIGLAVACGGNIDLIRIADHLYKNGPARAALVEQAQKAAGDEELLQSNYREIQAEIKGLALPIGWTDPGAVNAASAVGWLLTALASMLGAPFWFDILGKIMTVRSTLRPREASSGALAPMPAPAAVRPPAASGSTLLAPQDSGDIDMSAYPTADEELPAARGGVADKVTKQEYSR